MKAYISYVFFFQGNGSGVEVQKVLHSEDIWPPQTGPGSFFKALWEPLRLPPRGQLDPTGDFPAFGVDLGHLPSPSLAP